MRPAMRKSHNPATPCDGRASLQIVHARISPSRSSRLASSGETKRSSTWRAARQTLMAPLRKSLRAIFTLTHEGFFEANAASSAGPSSAVVST